MKQEKRIDEVDLLRGLAAILMILGHSFIVYPIDISGVFWCKVVQHFIYTFHMELFFVLAGIVYRCRNYHTFIFGKAKRILLPYLFFGSLTIIAKAFGGLFVNGTEPLGEGIFKLLFRGGGYWFLYVLFLIYAVYPMIERNCNQVSKKIIFIAVILILEANVKLPSIFMVDTLIHYIPYFIFGSCINESLIGRGG